MHVPFRRSQPASWSTRLWQVSRGTEKARFANPAPPPEPGGALLSLTLQTPQALDPAAVEADPVGAQRLPPEALVGALLNAAQENRSLKKKLSHRNRKVARLRARLDAVAVEDAEIRGRLATLEEVMAALHANVEDLRLARDQLMRGAD